MGFKDQIKKDVLCTFLNTAEFGETISYSQDNGGTWKNIAAQVIRKIQHPSSEDSARIGVNDFEIYISTDCSSGIALVVKGKDKVQIAKYQGSADISTYQVADILESDIASWHLLVRK